MEDNINVITALEALNNKQVVFTIDDNHKIFFKKENNEIRVINNNAFYSIDKDEFIKYYAKHIFFIVTDSSFEVSKEKDDEYYRYKHK